MTEPINETNAGESGKQAREREGELPSCLPTPWLLLCTAHSLSPQELKPSPHRFFGGIVSQEVREKEGTRRGKRERWRGREGGGRRSCIKSCLQNALRFR